MKGRKDPYFGFRFLIEIEGLILGGCSEVVGLSADTQIDEYREGGVNDRVLRFPKETKYPNLILKRGLTDSDHLWKWHHDVIQGKVERRTVHVIVPGSEGKDAWRLSFLDAYPVKWEQSELRADNSTILFETLELTHSGFTKY